MMRKRRSDSNTDRSRRCLSLEEVLDVVLGTMTEEDSSARAHIEQCPTCGETRMWVERLLDATTVPWEEPPASVAERAIRTFAREPLSEAPRRGWSLARLVHDTLASPLPAGVRGRGAGQRLLYDAGWADLDIDVRGARLDPDALQVTGRLLPRGGSPPGALIAVLSSPQAEVARATGDPVGLFVLSEVPPGTYRLEILSPEQGNAIAVEPFELRPGS